MKKSHSIDWGSYLSFQKSFDHYNPRRTRRVLIVVLLIVTAILLLPWTQTVTTTGLVTTILPADRPQEIHANIAGKIERWYIKEGDLVQAGDTLLQISEIKDAYLDPHLLQRTDEQIRAKEAGMQSYYQKIEAIEDQIVAMTAARQGKLSQIDNKVKQNRLYIINDSVALDAVATELKIAKAQYQRQKELYEQGLKSLTEFEQRKQALQNTEAKYAIAQNKYNNAQNELVNVQLDLTTVSRDYAEKIAKAQSDIYAALSETNAYKGDIAKLENQFSSYAVRNGFYYITAPQAGLVSKTLSAGIGEVIKEGQILLRVSPTTAAYQLELFASPLDVPLLRVGARVRIQFDGWPTFVFNGWPSASYGTFGGSITSVDNMVGETGKVRVLVSPTDTTHRWPSLLKVGSGAKGIVLLQDVMLGYEIWRKTNGFPPDFYSLKSTPTKKSK
jgi:membrane fusion protein, adhesin transport system